jgi:hypothetical protein
MLPRLGDPLEIPIVFNRIPGNAQGIRA